MSKDDSMQEMIYGLNEIPADIEITLRCAVKGIMIRNIEKPEILLIHTNKGDYKFAGGGVKNSESDSDALKREIMEECGFKLISMGECKCVTIEQNVDMFDPNKIFKMVSRYYFCEVDSEKRYLQSLDDYEKKQEFRSEWIRIEAAIENNERLLKSNRNDINPWVRRDTDVLLYIYEMLKKSGVRNEPA